ncbi:MAG: TusE/DsrC/DsvC family sulfur relay protein [Gaiellales bacterium]|nr:MAG: TusE/DsrC/DsvC family sulfur relay protein [Gaiellales bacterium]
MAVIEYQGVSVAIDDDGYLAEPENWNEDVARAISENEGVGELTGDMMDVINFMRSYYKNYHSFPILNAVCKNVHQPQECVNEEFIDPLSAWKIAGLANPGEEVVSYLKR